MLLPSILLNRTTGIEGHEKCHKNIVAARCEYFGGWLQLIVDSKDVTEQHMNGNTSIDSELPPTIPLSADDENISKDQQNSSQLQLLLLPKSPKLLTWMPRGRGGEGHESLRTKRLWLQLLLLPSTDALFKRCPTSTGRLNATEAGK